jgi:hypothetical protein
MEGSARSNFRLRAGRQLGSCLGHQPVRDTKVSQKYQKYGASKLRFTYTNEFLQKLSAIWTHTALSYAEKV